MVFNANGIHLNDFDKVALEYDGQTSLSWQEFRWLHRTVSNMFVAEAECEINFWDGTRCLEDSFDTAFNSASLPEFMTYHLGKMMVCLDRVAGVQ